MSGIVKKCEVSVNVGKRRTQENVENSLKCLSCQKVSKGQKMLMLKISENIGKYRKMSLMGYPNLLKAMYNMVASTILFILGYVIEWPL